MTDDVRVELLTVPDALALAEDLRKRALEAQERIRAAGYNADAQDEIRIVPIALSAPAIVVDGWQPIETAPKDGVSILIAGGTVMWDGSTYDDWFEHKGVTIAWWTNRHNGGWCSGNAEGYNEFIWHKPTVWQPLPAPPAALTHTGQNKKEG